MTTVEEIQRWLCSICATSFACNKVEGLDRTQCKARMELGTMIQDLDVQSEVEKDG